MRSLLPILLLIFALACESNAQQKFDALQLLSDIKTLSSDDYEGRKVGTPGSTKAQQYIIKRFVDYHLIPFDGNYKQDFTVERNGQKINGSNIVGYIQGSKNPEMFIAVTAHYDHLGVKDGEVYNGADDNASGVAGMFGIADYFSKNKPEYSIVFVAFDAEEIGLQGAKKFIEKSPFDLKKLLATINIDMISINDRQELFASGAYHNPFLKTIIEEANALQQRGVKLRLGHDAPESKSMGLDDWTYASDHGPFHSAGVPFVYFGVEDHKHYHKATDTFDKVNQVFFVNAVDLIIDFAALLDKKITPDMVKKTK